MDSVSIVLVILLGVIVVWMVVRANSNSKHSPPTRVRGGIDAASRSGIQGQAMGNWLDPEAPDADPRREDPGSGEPRR